MENNYKIDKLIPNVEEFQKDFPLSDDLKTQIKNDREEIINILNGGDSRKLLIIGPCSAWPKEAVIEYSKELKKLSDKYNDKIKIVLRVYSQKPRTILGWKGPLIEPNPFKKPDIEKGIKYVRKMMLDILRIGLPIADESLFTHQQEYVKDLLSWTAIGARSSEDQEHRNYASMLDIPVGIKNPTSGDIEKGIDSVIASRNPHSFLLGNRQITSFGNPNSHLILRGGNKKPNISLPELNSTLEKFEKREVDNPSIIIDVSHENSIDPNTNKKEFFKQPEILLKTLNSVKSNENLFFSIKGFMVESFLKEGKQDINKLSSIDEVDTQGLSITDSCIGLKDTEKLIKDLYNSL